MTRKFKCLRCGVTIEKQPEAYVAPDVLRKERFPDCCGSSMMELME